MRKLRILFIFLIMFLTVTTLSSCVAKALEKEITVVFMYEDEYIASDTVTQFKNIKTPTLPESYTPDGYKFLGWTPIPLSKIKPTDKNLKKEYIGVGKVLHYMEVKDYVDNFTVICRALMFDKNDIPKEYHYVAIAWYDKVATSGLNEELMNKFTESLNNYLKAEGVSTADLDTIVIRPYTGNVGPSCGEIMDDGDIDIMFGWGSVDNVTTTGGMKEEMLLESVSFQIKYNDTVKNRTIHRLTDSETVIKVMEWMKSDSCRAIFN